MTATATFFDEKTKIAIARIVSDIINADGIIDSEELDILQKIKFDYGLNRTHFRKIMTMTLSAAINQIVSVDWSYSEKDGSMLCDDLNRLASIDGRVAHNEAMICLALRYALYFQGAHVFDYNKYGMRFSKKEIIYIENEHSELNKEITEFYDSVCNVLGMYGFKFVYIPHIQQKFTSVVADKDRMIQILEYLHPDLVPTDVLKKLYFKLATCSTAEFSRYIMSEGVHITSFPPSLLLKISSSKITKGNNDIETYNNFLQIPIKPGYSILNTIQNFLRKYIDLIRETVSLNTLRTERFNIHSFHKTLLDFYIAMNDNADSLTFVIKGKRENKVLFGNLQEVAMSVTQMSYYLLLVYLDKSDKTVLSEISKEENPERWTMYYDLYRLFYSELNQLDHLIPVVDFETNTRGNYYKIKDKIGSIVGLRNKSQFNPYKDRSGLRVNFPQPVYIESDGDRLDICDWVNLKIKKYKI